MAMPLEKAKGIMQAYKDNDYVASKALPRLGYARNSVRARSGEILDTAVNTIVRAGDNDAILEYLGITDKDIATEYLFIVNQKKDMSSKLKALQPLLARKGIKWDDQKVQMNPTLNLTVKEVMPSLPDKTQEAEIVKPNTEKVEKDDTESNSTAQPSPL
jgi:hypothetical protein